jgi:predicted metal-dependent peptidase
MNQKKARQLIDKAKISIIPMANTDFIGSILFSLNQVITTDTKTADVDGITIRFNPDFVSQLTVAEVIFLLLHESWHVAFEHILRAKNIEETDFELFNQAADYVINYMLVSTGFTMPKGGLYNVKFANMSTEQVYNYLLKERKQNPNQQPESNTLGSDLRKGPVTDLKGNKVSEEELIAKVEDIILGAASIAKQAGTYYGSVPGELQRHHNALLEPKVNWEEQLMDIATSIDHSDYSRRKPNRRYLPMGIYMPSLYSECAGHIAVAMDLSGSVTELAITKAVTEMYSIREMMAPELMTIIGFDSKISDVNELYQGDELDDINLTGGGGTNIHPVMEWGMKHNPDVLVIITDGHFRYFDKQVDFPVIWLIVGNPNFSDINGTIVHYED